VDLPFVVFLLFEDVLQEHQLDLQAVFITNSCGSVYKSGWYGLFIGWVRMEHGVCVVLRNTWCSREPSALLYTSKYKNESWPSHSLSVVN
jgi:hypothetical protein